MIPAFRPRTLVLFVGDLVFFTLSLWLSLYLRVLALPSQEVFFEHLVPFSLLFIAWIIIFFIAGLYESRSIILERRAISATLLVSQVINIAIAALFFFFIPIFGIAPKTLLFIYAAVSFLLVLLWRTVFFPRLGLGKQENAVVVGSGSEVAELIRALTRARFAPVHIVAIIDTEHNIAEAVKSAVAAHHPRVIIADFNNRHVAQVLPELYNYLSEGVRFVEALPLYEEVFGRIPLSIIDEKWIAHNVSRYSYTLYDSFKRLTDIIIALPAAIISLIFYPFIILAILIEDRGAPIISMPRVGEADASFPLYKFRSMSGNDRGMYGKEGTSKLHVTTVGRVLRVTRLDELPQLWGIVLGDLSFVGPRPEVPALVELYEKEIPFYKVRHLVRPGLSGWAQLYGEHAHHGVDLETTKNKLSYDLYYIKHRSLTLDLTIAIKTLRKLLTRSGV